MKLEFKRANFQADVLAVDELVGSSSFSGRNQVLQHVKPQHQSNAHENLDREMVII